MHTEEMKHGTGTDPPKTTRRKEPTPATRLKNLLQFELWHQRLAHIGKDKLMETQKCVEGISALHMKKAVAPLIHCAACNTANMKKVSKNGTNAAHEEGLKPRQQFQMDIGFFCGSSNLLVVLERMEKPKTEGYHKPTRFHQQTSHIDNHGWQDHVAATKPVLMQTDRKAMDIIETVECPTTEAEQLAIESQAGFRYCSVMSEIVYAMVTARPDLSFITTKLS